MLLLLGLFAGHMVVFYLMAVRNAFPFLERSSTWVLLMCQIISVLLVWPAVVYFIEGGTEAVVLDCCWLPSGIPGIAFQNTADNDTKQAQFGQLTPAGKPKSGKPQMRPIQICWWIRKAPCRCRQMQWPTRWFHAGEG